MTRPVRYASDAEIDALEALCAQLNGFGAQLNAEYVDGYFAALLAGRRAVPPSEWLPALTGDAFERACSDPQAVQQAMAVLLRHWNCVASQLDAESLADQPETLRLAPLMAEYNDEDRAKMVATGDISAEDAADATQTGTLWAMAFGCALDDFSADWPDPPDDDDEADLYADAVDRVLLLAQPKAEREELIADLYPGDAPPDRDELIIEACYSVQYLRLYWLDHGLKPTTRHVEPQPGRNDPCPCGSGKKFKKCHGANV